MSYIEIAGFIFSLLGIYFATREKIIAWPLQIVASTIYVYLFLSVHLFGESLLQGVYIVLAFYGWHHWRKGTTGRTLPVTRLSKRQWLFMSTTGLILTLLLAQFQVQFLPTDVPYLDSLIFVFGLLAQWMQANKKIENWIYWIILDLIAAGIYWHKDFKLTALLYIILTALALQGWIQWRRHLALQSLDPSPPEKPHSQRI